MKVALLIAAVVVLAPVLGLAALSIFSRKPTNLGVHGGRLTPCPESPNCVCTDAKDAQHAIEPIKFEGSAADGMRRAKTALTSLPRIAVVEETANYLRAESTSLLFRFVDDVEIFLDESTHTIHFRSASRAGRGDLGVNRKRMEAFRSAFASAR